MAPPPSPAVQMRVLLLGLRGQGVAFEAAWRTAFKMIRWPHDTWHRKEWKKLFGGDETVALLPSEQARADRIKAVWRDAYEQRPVTAAAQPLVELAAVA